MKPSDLRLILGCVAAVIVPAAVLHFAAPSERLAAGLTAAPFGWPRVLLAHLVTALPLGLVAARWLRASSAVHEAAPVLWVAVGAGGAGLAAAVCPALGEAVSGGGLDATVLLVLRAALALALVLPWCVWALAKPEPGANARVGPGVLFGLGAAAAVVPCGLYAEAVVAARTEQAADLVRRERVVRADAVLTGLVELGSDRPVGKKPPAEVRKAYAAVIPRLKQAGNGSLSPAAPPKARLERALLMIQLDRLDEAADLLRPLAEHDDTAALLLATVLRDQERWATSDELYARVLDAQLPRAATDRSAAGACLTAVEGLAFNARADGRPADAERVLTRGLDALPAHAAQFHFFLGQHYHDGGRTGPAVEHLRAAARLDPASHAEPAAKLIRQIQTATPACLTLRSP